MTALLEEIFVAVDLIIYAVIAAGLIFWLRSILGTRHGDERERPNPFAETVMPPAPREMNAVSPAMTLEDKLAALGRDKDRVGIIENKTAEIIEAKTEGKTAFITLRFRADEVSWTKNALGEITAGHESRITEMRDIWTFMRDLRGKDPRWLISETRGGFEGDNDIVPNS
jgi:hypothetical protein